MPRPGQPVVGRDRRTGRGAATAQAIGLLLVAAGASAQPVNVESAAALAVPRSYGLSTGLTFELDAVDVRGRAVGSGTEVVARTSPSVTLVNRGGRLQGTLIYTGTLSARRGIADREENNYQNGLSASYVLEAIEGVGFVDARASITQQQISAIGGPVDTPQAGRDNRTEVRTLSLSPYLRGTLAGVAEFELRGTTTNTDASDQAVSDSEVRAGSFYLRSPRRAAVFGWGLAGSRQRVTFSTAATPNTTDRLTAELSLQPDIDWRFTVSAGQERTNVVAGVRQDYENYGASLQWTPSPRTTVQLQAEERYFGHAWRVLVEHRYMRSTFRLSSSRDVSIGSDTVSAGQAVTLYEVYFTQFASLIPDPVQRDQFVLALIQALGRSRNEVVSGALFGNGGISALRRNDATWTWAGQRLTMSLSAFNVESERVDDGGVAPAARNDNTAQSGYAASLGWRLTPLTTISATGSRAMSKDKLSFLGTDQKSVSLGLATRLGPRTSGVLGARYSVLNGTVDSSRETALTGSLSLRF